MSGYKNNEFSFYIREKLRKCLGEGGFESSNLLRTFQKKKEFIKLLKKFRLAHNRRERKNLLTSRFFLKIEIHYGDKLNHRKATVPCPANAWYGKMTNYFKPKALETNYTISKVPCHHIMITWIPDNHQICIKV